MRASKYLLIAATIGFAIAGCSSGDKTAEGTTGAGGEKIKIAVIPKGSTHDFWKHVHQGADLAASELGNVEIIFNGPEVESDKNSQINMMETMINKGVKGIVLAPLDFDALVKSVEDADKAGIPVVIIDSDVNTQKYVSFVATDNLEGGKKDADEMIRLLNGKGRVAVLRYQKGSASTDLREKGFIDQLKTAPGITIVSDNQEAGPTRESALKGSENMLAKFRKGDALDLEGIYCPNESSTFGMMKYLEDNKLAGKVKFVGFDAAPELVDGLNKGTIDALIVQNPDRMGHDGVKTLVEYITGKNKNPDKRIDTGATLVTKANMNEPDVKKLLEPAK
jgi:ribose transport system substrate-binding protein